MVESRVFKMKPKTSQKALKKALWKDIRRCLAKSKGRFISILCLVALGSFALVGLQISGPDMRYTGEHYFNQQKLSDLSVIGDFGLNQSDCKLLDQTPNLETIEYGYLKDVVVKDSQTGLRIYSLTDKLSLPVVTSGRLPRAKDEIVLASFMAKQYGYKIGDRISFTEKADISDHKVFDKPTFKIVGFVDSPELLSIINMGQSTAGTGELNGYGLVIPSAFDSDVYMIARLRFKDTQGLDPYSKLYTQRLEAHKTALNKLLAAQPALRFKEIQKQFQDRIADAQKKIDDARNKLESARATIDKNRTKLQQSKSAYQEGLEKFKNQKADAEERLEKAQSKLDHSSAMITGGELMLAQNQAEYSGAQMRLIQEGLDKQQEAMAAGQSEVQLTPEEAAQYAAAKEKLAKAKAQLDQAEEQIAAARLAYEKGLDEFETKKLGATEQFTAAQKKLDDAAQQIADGEEKLNKAEAEFASEAPKAEEKIADGQKKLDNAQANLANLKPPVYALDTRRELPGSEGYRIYSSVANIVDSLADIFPIFLYFVAALVTLTTMTRFVDEERINAGTLKALGYNKRDILKKFTVYGFLASMSGAIVGIAAGHTLLPFIVYNAYGEHFALPPIELHFYPWISLGALVLALLCAVVPAFIVAEKELQEKPAALLMPKAPEKGSKILLERVKPVWSRLTFTQKVTARNLFRYKKRMLMTIFGVCGAVTLIFAGFSVQNSIGGIKDRQFGEIIKFDLIVAQNDGQSQNEAANLQKQLADPSIQSELPIHYEQLNKEAGRNKDKQEINLIVPERAGDLKQYIRLVNRRTDRALSLDKNGCLLSERLARLLKVKVGDNFSIKDANEREHQLRVAGITEMYMGHYIFMDKDYYQTAFGKSFKNNAYLVTLKDRSVASANLAASKFMALTGVKGVVQNTTFINEIDTIVKSLNQIMTVLIIVAILLGVVILYNLTNINVSERIRELSTIKVLGFYNKEVTLYIYRETIILTILGILAGYLFGDFLYLYIINIVPPDNVMFDPALGANAFWIPVVVVALITFVLGILVNRRLRYLNMLEALKSVD